MLDPGEQCDDASDAACPGACAAPAPPAWRCVTCDASGAACSGPKDPSCAGNCVSTTTACTCPPPALPQCQPGATDTFICDPACALAGARLFYREETAGSADFTEVEVALVDRPDPVNDPQRIRVAVRYQRPSGTDEFETSLTFGGGSGGSVTPSAAGAAFRGLPIYTMLVCGWPLGCDDDSRPILANGDTYAFDLRFGFGPRHERFTVSSAGCGGGAARVNAAWAGVRCGEVAQLPTDLLCRDDNPSGSLVAPICCGCPSDPVCPDSGPTCTDGVCQ